MKRVLKWLAALIAVLALAAGGLIYSIFSGNHPIEDGSEPQPGVRTVKDGFVIVNTSRGGLITLLLAAAQPGRIGAVVLNDIGPVIETDGLIRIAGYVGRYPVPKSWADAPLRSA